jgi:hypothetical protein
MCNLDKIRPSKIRNRSTVDFRKPVTSITKVHWKVTRGDKGMQRCKGASRRICLKKKSRDRMKYEKRDSMAEKLTLTFRHTLSSSETVIIISAQETPLTWLTRSKSCYSTKKNRLKKLFFKISCAIRVTVITCLALRFVLSAEMNIIMKDKQMSFSRGGFRESEAKH